jgi:hypothetical protein
MASIYFGGKNYLLTQEIYLPYFWVGSVTATKHILKPA